MKRNVVLWYCVYCRVNGRWKGAPPAKRKYGSVESAKKAAVKAIKYFQQSPNWKVSDIEIDGVRYTVNDLIGNK